MVRDRLAGNVLVAAGYSHSSSGGCEVNIRNAMNTKRAFQAVAAALAAVALVQAVPIPNGAEDTAALAAAAGGEDGTAFTDSFSQRFKNGFVAAFSMMIVSEI
eukprot:gene25967-31569_t